MEEIKKKAREMLRNEITKYPQMDALGTIDIIDSIIDLAVSKERERIRESVERALKYSNWSHSVGSHSDDRGGDSDIECTCMEQEIKHKEEAYKNVLNLINTK